jgi:hypothetical protein
MKVSKKIILISLGLGFFSFPAYADLNTDQICRAGIATIMGKSPSIITVDSKKGDVKYLSYIRKEDNTKWKYKCQVKGFRIHWGSIDSDGTEGRWRTNPADDQVIFETDIDTITVTEGGYNSKTFKNSEL